MPASAVFQPVDYLAIGHLTCDVTDNGLMLGGSVAYSALVAHAFGLRVGIFTAFGNEIPLKILTDKGISICAASAEHSTTFENIYNPNGRIQKLRHIAPLLDLNAVPKAWRNASIIHLAPVAQEVSALLPVDFNPALLGLTLQGWLRERDSENTVHACGWTQPDEALQKANAVIVSVEDVAHNEEQIEHFVVNSHLLAVTESFEGSRLYWNHDLRRFRPPQVTEVDATGAGDIFGAAFFIRLRETRDPWEAARFANQIAAISVTRKGLDGAPTREEIQKCLVEVIH